MITSVQEDTISIVSIIGTKLKKSKYAFFIEKDNGEYIVYSSLSGAVILFSEESYINRLKNIIKDDEIFYDENDDIIVTLKAKKLFVDSTADEDLMVRTLYEENIVRNNVLDLMLVVTKQCNLRCTYCGQSHENKRMEADTYDSIINFIQNQLKTHGYRKVQITFFGGEPLMECKNIILFLTNLKEMLLSEFDGIEYTAGMSTNGYLLTPKNFDALVSLNCNFYQISVDGMDYTHDNTRPLVNGGRSWQQIIDNIKYMTSTNEKFSITLRTNFNIDVAESLIEFYKYVSEHFKSDKRINIYYETIKDQGNENTPIILNETEELVLDIDIAKIIKDNELSCSNAVNRNMPCSRVCYASKPNYFIFDEEKKIMKCSFEFDSENNCIGLLKSDGTFNINEGNYSKWVYSDYLSSEKCKNCKALPLCLGKRCPRTIINTGSMDCNIDIISNEIEGIIKNYY